MTRMPSPAQSKIACSSSRASCSCSLVRLRWASTWRNEPATMPIGSRAIRVSSSSSSGRSGEVPDDPEQLVDLLADVARWRARAARAVLGNLPRRSRAAARAGRRVSHRDLDFDQVAAPRARDRRRRTPCSRADSGMVVTQSRLSVRKRSRTALPAQRLLVGVDLPQGHQQRRGADLPADVVLDRLHVGLLSVFGAAARRSGSRAWSGCARPPRRPGSRPARKSRLEAAEDRQSRPSGARRCRSAPSARPGP